MIRVNLLEIDTESGLWPAFLLLIFVRENPSNKTYSFTVAAKIKSTIGCGSFKLCGW